jgi:hypothetical protein
LRLSVVAITLPSRRISTVEIVAPLERRSTEPFF